MQELKHNSVKQKNEVMVMDPPAIDLCCWVTEANKCAYINYCVWEILKFNLIFFFGGWLREKKQREPKVVLSVWISVNRSWIQTTWDCLEQVYRKGQGSLNLLGWSRELEGSMEGNSWMRRREWEACNIEVEFRKKQMEALQMWLSETDTSRLY